MLATKIKQHMTINFEKIDKVENWIFLSITILNLIPIFVGKFFPTMDGAAHLYNSNLINNLLFESKLNDFFIFNPEPVPNWTSHLFLSILNKFTPAFIAEKVFLILYFIGLPYAFRRLVKVINSKNIFFSYLIFPFTYSFMFMLGFYNFSIAIIFMFITLQYWIKYEDNFSIKRKIIFFLFIILTYFSHILVFAITLLLIGLNVFFKNVVQAINSPNSLNKCMINAIKKTKTLIIISFIPLLLLFYYFYSRPSTGNNVFLKPQELIDWLKNIRSIIIYNISIEEVYTKKIFYSIIILLLAAFYNRINAIGSQFHSFSKRKLYSTIKGNLYISDLWIFAAIIILIMYFVLPDSNGSAGFLSARLGFLFFILLIIWLSAQKYPKWLIILSVIVVLYCNFKLVKYYASAIKTLNKIAVNCNEASLQIEPNSIVLPLNYSDNWLVGHFSNYLGIDKPMIILENYECGTGYFPLKWNKNIMPNILLGNLSSNEFPCVFWESNMENTKVKIDYVFVLGTFEKISDSCNLNIKNVVLDNYNLIYSNNNCQLYKIKSH